MPQTDEHTFFELVTELSERAIEEASSDGRIVHRRWSDPSGASLALHLKGDSIACLTPFFVPEDGLTRWTVRTTAPRRSADCIHCSGADCDLLDASGELVTRAMVQWLHFAPYRTWLQTPRRFELEIVAFARSAQFFEDVASFRASHQSSREASQEGASTTMPEFAENAFIPLGMFDEDDTQRPTALFGGRILLAERRVNARTGEAFHRIRVQALPGEIDVVVGAFEGEPRVGALTWFDAWLVGRPVEPPPPASPRGWLGRLFR